MNDLHDEPKSDHIWYICFESIELILVSHSNLYVGISWYNNTFIYIYSLISYSIDCWPFSKVDGNVSFQEHIITVIKVRSSPSHLIEYRSEATYEGPHASSDEALRIHVRIAHMEHAAPVSHVCVVPVLEAVAAEGR